MTVYKTTIYKTTIYLFDLWEINRQSIIQRKNVIGKLSNEMIFRLTQKNELFPELFLNTSLLINMVIKKH